ncbi:CLUMA_CG007707, isoform A [Clunio marinus]|uniref:CLUMA_CG007707, isoform A n=1 Tax=Clunio marinus TaxID=568069 RepID=A0A1J1I1H1_9DIPT|nr:CLUMA_CG007707, isoform A [Clunio marinus]
MRQSHAAQCNHKKEAECKNTIIMWIFQCVINKHACLTCRHCIEDLCTFCGVAGRDGIGREGADKAIATVSREVPLSFRLLPGRLMVKAHENEL